MNANLHEPIDVSLPYEIKSALYALLGVPTVIVTVEAADAASDTVTVIISAEYGNAANG
jgi:hypothetical protein